MRDNLMLDFPVLTVGGGDFCEDVAYEVSASQKAGNLVITHKLTGRSFVRRLVEAEKAKFSVLLVYRNSSERQHYSEAEIIKTEKGDIEATQMIAKSFSYSPAIMPSIFLLGNETISAKDAWGVTDIWQDGEFNIPQYARIARHPKLMFTDGKVSSLFSLVYKDKLEDGQMEVVVDEHAGEGKAPVTLYCAEDVFDDFKKNRNVFHAKKPRNAAEAARFAIVTHALSCLYAHMREQVESGDNDEATQIEGVLAAHLHVLQHEYGADWRDPNFNPSLAATKMTPFYIKAMQGGEDDE